MGRHSAAAGSPAAGPLFLAPDFTVASADLAPDFTVPSAQNVRWLFQLSDGEPLEWFWDEWGTPPMEELRPYRNPRSSENNRHIPVTAYSMTMGDHICLESGLEHDLLRRVDRDPAVRLIVAQPLRLSWPGNKAGSRSRKHHTPDLLTARGNGEVTVFDARPEDRIDEDFRAIVELTRRACHDIGWRYELFTGLANAERLNLIWLHGFRKRPPWTDQIEDKLLSAITAADTTLGGLFALDDGSGKLTSAVWHLIWRGVLSVDISAPITMRTTVTVAKERTNV